MKNIIFNPFFKDFKTPIGAVNNSDEILITIKIVKTYNIHQLRLIIKNDFNNIYKNLVLKFKETIDDHNIYQVSFKISDLGIYWYYFEFDDTYGTHYIGSSNSLDSVLTDYYPVAWQLGIHSNFIGDLDWFKGKVIYQIMVDRFYNGGVTYVRDDAIMKEWNDIPYYGDGLYNDFFGGDLKGVTKKLEYLKSLNVGVIYLNPIFEAFSNHKYDTADYMKIDPMFGTEDDFIELCNRAKALGIEIVLDGVFNHTGDNSRYFNKYGNYEELGAYQSEESKFSSWYKFRNHPDDYDSWWGFKSLPDINQEDHDYLNFITNENGVLDKWLSLGAKGFRLDVVDELNDTFINKIRDRIKTNNPDNILIGEVWEDASHKMAYGKRRTYFNGSQLDSVMNYPFKNAIIDYLKHNNYLGLKHKIRQIINNYPKHVVDSLMNNIGTHDTERIINAFSYVNVNNLNRDEQARYVMNYDERLNAKQKAKMAACLEFMLPGVPTIYYGDEICMEGFKDPFCRKTFKWDNMNEEFLNWYKVLGRIRSDKVFVNGEYQEEYIENNIFAFSRVCREYKIFVIINNSNSNFTYNINNGYDLIKQQVINNRITTFSRGVNIIKIDLTN